MAKKKTKTTPQAAPEPAPVALEGPGYRTPSAWSPRDRCPRPAGELTKTATLIRGTSWRISYSRPGPLVFPHGDSVAINESEFARLSGAIDRIDYPDESRGVRIEQSIRKFIFHDIATGDQIEMAPLPDKEVGPFALSIADQRERDRKFEGAGHTAR